MTRLQLANTFDECPIVWQNLINHIISNDLWFSSDDDTEQIPKINSHLSDYKAIYHPTEWTNDSFVITEDAYIEFEDPELFILFMLRWS